MILIPIGLVLIYYPDLRKCINTIQLSTLDGGANDLYLSLDQSILVSSNYIDKVINALSEGSKHNKIDCYNDIRQIIADANVNDFDELFRALYERSSEYLQDKEGTAAILINEHQYNNLFYYV